MGSVGVKATDGIVGCGHICKIPTALFFLITGRTFSFSNSSVSFHVQQWRSRNNALKDARVDVCMEFVLMGLSTHVKRGQYAMISNLHAMGLQLQFPVCLYVLFIYFYFFV